MTLLTRETRAAAAAALGCDYYAVRYFDELTPVQKKFVIWKHGPTGAADHMYAVTNHMPSKRVAIKDIGEDHVINNTINDGHPG